MNIIKTTYLTFLFILFQNTFLFAQSYQIVDSKVKEYPASFSKHEKLAALINQDFETEIDKARAIYTWIALNIAYDVKSYYSGSKTYSYSYSSEKEKIAKEIERNNKIARTTLKKGKGVCEDYSTLFYRLCELTGIECVIIQGASKTVSSDIGKCSKGSDHAWNGIKIDDHWRLIDVTWGAGSLDYSSRKFIAKYTDTYFLTPPELFFLNHFPENTKWMLVDKSAKDFADLPLYYCGYLDLDIEIIEPKSGIINSAFSKEIVVKLKTSLEPEEFLYHFSKSKYSETIDYTRENDLIVFKIPLTGNKSKYLTLFYDQDALVVYKLK